VQREINMINAGIAIKTRQEARTSMAISVFDLLSIGIGPSSSHTVGPMRAAHQFICHVEQAGLLNNVSAIKIDLYGSLALTGKGHTTDTAIILGLEGYTPDKVEPDEVPHIIAKSRHNRRINLLDKWGIPFIEEEQIVFHMDKQLPYHPNGMRFTAFDCSNRELHTQIYYSVGGGFIIDHTSAGKDAPLGASLHILPMPFRSSQELLTLSTQHQLTIAEIMMTNECSWHHEEEVRRRLLEIWRIMRICTARGCQTEGILPGGLNVKRRAAELFKKLTSRDPAHYYPSQTMEWVSLWALAVNEENASGGRIVTAPTNGASGIIPAVLHYYTTMTDRPDDEGIITFLLTAAAIGILYKEGASISAAEMGCMGEVGVACSMAAAGLTAALGGTTNQIENAAEIGMEHNLGLTCDPIKGLVQIPCIERNTMGAVKAINATLLALQGNGTHYVSLDQVIATMRQTGHDMQSIYKETSLGGLAVNVPEC
jgi:L-serine dehydratase